MKNLFSFELKVCYMRPVILALLSFGRQNGLQYNGTLQALFLQFAAVFIRNGNIAVNKVGIGMAAAAAEELGPAVAADGLVEDVHVAEERRQFRIGHAVIDVANDVAIQADELMARINVTVR